MKDAEKHKDFFISYRSADRNWAEWIAWQLEQGGYTTIIQAWDFQAGTNFVLKMDTATKSAECTIAVLSPDYFTSSYTAAEWAAAFRRDPSGQQRYLIPVRVRSCDVEGLLGQIVYIDLVGQDEQAARTLLLTGLRNERAKPSIPPRFPFVHMEQLERPTFPGALPPLWNIPYPRNPFFTGREDTLRILHSRLNRVATLTQLQAISGLSGMGKTQIAVEFAYRYGHNYQAVLWANANSREILQSDFSDIASLLGLSEKNAQNLNFIVTAIKRWLQQHSDWLLILDDVEDLVMVKEFIPWASRGHVLLTTPIIASGSLAESTEVKEMSLDEGALFLLRQSGVIEPEDILVNTLDDEQINARTITQSLGGLPLALAQAGAYIGETKCSLTDYLRFYQVQHADLLKEEGFVRDHPRSVSTTWALTFEKVQQANLAAAELLRFCAFLYFDTIPEEIIIKGASQLGPILGPVATEEFLLNNAYRVLLRFSLVHRYPSTQTLSIHRLVQTVLRDGMDRDTQCEWAERVVRVVSQAFPTVEFITWQHCQRYLPHAQACLIHIEQWNMKFPEAVRLLSHAGYYLWERGQFAAAEPFYKLLLAISEQEQGPNLPDIVNNLNNLARLYHTEGKYLEAELLFQRVLTIWNQILESEHFDLIPVMENYADLLRKTQQETKLIELEARIKAIKQAQENLLQ